MKKTAALKILNKNSLSSLGFKHKKSSCLLNEKGNQTAVRKNKNLKLKDNVKRKIIRRKGKCIKLGLRMI